MKTVHKLSKNRRKNKVRSKVSGSADRPRLSVFRSNKYTYIQAVNDSDGKTIASSATSLLKDAKGSKIEQASKLGEEFGKKLAEMKIKSCVFDRSHYKYHGRVKSLADGIRKSGVQI